jgi:hypothetical protein
VKDGEDQQEKDYGLVSSEETDDSSHIRAGKIRLGNHNKDLDFNFEDNQ